MPNIGGPWQSSRKLLTSVVNSVITYGTAMCGDIRKNQECRPGDTPVFFVRYQTMLAEERKRLYQIKSRVTKQQTDLKKIEGKRAFKDVKENGMYLRKGGGRIA